VLSNRTDKISLSTTMKIAAEAIMMKEQGIDLVDFSVGEPDFPTPAYIQKAAIDAISLGKTKYTMNQGVLALREAICRKFSKDNQLDYSEQQILVSNGAKHSTFNIISALIGNGDEVIIPVPYWVSYSEMVRMAGGKPVFVNTTEQNGFKISKAQLMNAITQKTKAIMLNNPCNPTGAAYSQEDLQELAAVVEETGIYVISDEIYEKLIYEDKKFVSFASLNNKMKNVTILINGVSKAYAMTGWRIGYAAGPEDIIAAANKIQSHSTSNASSISQYAALAALEGPQNDMNNMRNEFQKRRDYVLERLLEIKGISTIKPDGAFYVFPNVSEILKNNTFSMMVKNSADLAYLLLKEAKVALIPGSAFGIEGYLRISYTNSLENIKKGMDRIARQLA